MLLLRTTKITKKTHSLPMLNIAHIADVSTLTLDKLQMSISISFPFS